MGNSDTPKTDSTRIVRAKLFPALVILPPYSCSSRPLPPAPARDMPSTRRSFELAKFADFSNHRHRSYQRDAAQLLKLEPSMGLWSSFFRLNLTD